MKKILIINCLDIRYGSTHRMRRFFGFLQREYDVTYMESNYVGGDGRVISVRQSMTPAGFLLGTLKRLYQTLMTEHDILFVQKFSPFTVPCAVLSKLAGRTVIIDCDDKDSDFQSSLFRKKVTELFEWIGPRFCDCVLTHNSYLKKDILRIAPGVPVHIVDQGVDTRMFDPSAHDGDGFRGRKFPAGGKVAVYATGFGAGGTRDLDMVIQAFFLAKKKLPSMHLVLIGGGPLLEGYRERYGGEGIEFTGYLPQDEVAEYIAAADAGLVYMRENPGNVYRVSLKVLEYLSMMKPVAGRITGLTKDLWGKYCLTCGDSAEEFSEKILEAMRVKAPCGGAREIISRKYDWNIIGQRLLETVRAAAEL